MNSVALILAAAAIAADPEPVNQATIVAAISGNGSLTAGLDASGALTSLRWPGPGGPDQLRPAEANQHELPLWYGGGRFGFEIDGRWWWQGDPRAVVGQAHMFPGSTTVETMIEWPDVGLVVRQRAGVYPNSNVFVCAVEIVTAPATPGIVWVGDIAPCTRQVPELAGAGNALTSLHGFAAFQNMMTARRWAWSFRPDNPSSKDWERARELCAANAPARLWAEFGDGVWIGIGGASSRRQRTGIAPIGFVPSVNAAIDVLEYGTSTSEMFVGQSKAVVGLGATGRAWVVISVGANHADSRKLLGDELPDAYDFFTSAPGDSTFLPKAAKLPEILSLQLMPHLAILSTLHDSSSDFTVRGVSSDPPLARDWPRDGALAAWAWFESGLHDAAWKSIDAYVSLIRTDDRPRKPYGSMPESVYTSGEPASPHFIVDDRGPARVLWVADRMLKSSEPQARASWVTAHWKSIEAAGEFLSTWSDAGRGAPLYADDPLNLSDAETQDRLFAQYAGISGAIRLAEAAGKSVPEAWHNRQSELTDLCAWVLKEPGRWLPGGSLVLETEGLPADALSLLAATCAERLANPASLDRPTIARLGLQRALLVPNNAADADLVLLLLDQPDPNRPNSPDALVSAQALLTALLTKAN